jgi:DNA-binding NtrC family response regulator
MKPYVLIIDDEDNLRKLLARVIELEGYTVNQASSIKEAIKALNQNSYQVVVSDVKLPDGNGVELTARIKMSFRS